MSGLVRMDNMRIVLVETSHPGNIGAAARAMKTMGLTRLRLVAPSSFPSAEATERAAGADDILRDAEIFSSLEQAIADTEWAVGASARRRHLDWPELSPEACAGELAQRAGHGAVALVFGRERSGLSNAELDRCQALVRIPTAASFHSLNLGSAVQLLTYAVRQACTSQPGSAARSGSDSKVGNHRATPDELEGLYRHLEDALVEIGYYDPEKPKLLMRRLRRLFARAQLENAELNILRGILRAAQKSARNQSAKNH